MAMGVADHVTDDDATVCENITETVGVCGCITDTSPLTSLYPGYFRFQLFLFTFRFLLDAVFTFKCCLWMLLHAKLHYNAIANKWSIAEHQQHFHI